MSLGRKFDEESLGHAQRVSTSSGWWRQECRDSGLLCGELDDGGPLFPVKTTMPAAWA